jgi:hypothetical protein
VKKLSLAFAFFFISIAPTPAASFDCHKKATQAEKAICFKEEQSQLDEELNKEYNITASAAHYYLAERILPTDEKKKVPNVDPVCKAYVDALNKYPLVEDFFKAPMQPKSPELDYPNWEQLDIYEYKDIYLRAYPGRLLDLKTYEERKIEVEKSHMMEDTQPDWYKNLRREQEQMYYSRADIDNDGNIDDIIKKDRSRYNRYKEYFYGSYLTVFQGNTTPKFAIIDSNLSNKFRRASYIYDIFFYKNKSYIKEISYDLVSEGFTYMYIKKFDDKKELIPLCFILAKDKGGEINVSVK